MGSPVVSLLAKGGERAASQKSYQCIEYESGQKIELTLDNMWDRM